jgi:hypothetical protein
MLKFNRLTPAMALALASAPVPIASAHASVTYTYTGADFTSITHDAGAQSHFTTSDKITGSITFNTALGDNLNFSNQAGNLANFDFNAGDFGLSSDFVASYLPTCGCSFFLSSLFVDTDSSGNVTGWLINIGLGGYGSLFLEGGKEGSRSQAIAYPTETGLVNASGTFAPAAVPEPASWALMLGGFGMVGGAMRSRRKVSVSFG